MLNTAAFSNSLQAPTCQSLSSKIYLPSLLNQSSQCQLIHGINSTAVNMSDSRPLMRGGVLKHERFNADSPDSQTPASFATTTMPTIYTDTVIVAAASPNVQKGHPAVDGWFLSDFYAFNYLLNGAVPSQTWLTAAVCPSYPILCLPFAIITGVALLPTVPLPPNCYFSLLTSRIPRTPENS